jgi:hypothetical protein
VDGLALLAFPLRTAPEDGGRWFPLPDSRAEQRVTGGRWGGVEKNDKKPDGTVRSPIEWDAIFLLDGNKRAMSGEIFLSAPTLTYWRAVRAICPLVFPRMSHSNSRMKATWTLIFAACIAATVGIAWLVVPDAAHSDKFWLSLGGIVLALLFLYHALAFGNGSGGEQGGSFVRGQTAAAGALYLLATLALAGVAVTGIGFRFLLALHIGALLVWVVLVATGALGAQALRGADGQK